MAAPRALNSDRLPSDPGGPVVDRRRTSRIHQLNVATLQPVTGDTQIEWSVLVCNISLGGIAFRCDHKLRVGETYRITVGTGPHFLNARIRVTNVRSRSDGKADIGAAFH